MGWLYCVGWWVVLCGLIGWLYLKDPKIPFSSPEQKGTRQKAIVNTTMTICLFIFLIYLFIYLFTY